jgi:uncharacterized phage infection (PIP) family protein YhgE
MIKETITKLEDKVKHINSIKEENKTQLLNLLSTLKSEIEELAQTEGEHAESIVGFTEISTHEATRQDKDQQRLKHSVDELASSVEGFEVSHPTLVGTVNALCVMLSNLGI